MRTVVSVVIVLCALLIPLFAQVALGQETTSLTGAIWTTDEFGTVNKNLYDSKCDVYLLGGPRKEGSAGLPDGDYYVQVTNPNGTVVLGRSWNNDSSIVRVVRVVDGEFNELLENGLHWGDPPVHLCTFLFSGPAFTSAGYADTPNPGGEYKVCASPDQDFVESKTDNFKVGPTPPEPVLKTFKLTVPAILLDPAFDAAFGDAVFLAWYTFDDPAGITPPVWFDLLLEPEDTLVFSAEEEFADGDTIWWKFTVTSTGYSCVSPIHGPETLTAPTLYTNKEVLKAFELSVPAMLVDFSEFADVDFSAWYSLTNPATDGNWVEVSLINLTKEDDTYLFFGLALFKANNIIWWKFTATDTYYSWESSIGGPETLAWPNPDPVDGYVNAEVIPTVLKTWSLLVGFDIPEAEYFASWSVDQTTWHDVSLVQGPAGVWTGTTEFPIGIIIYYKFRAEWHAIIFWQSGLLGPETLNEPITNEVTIPTLTKHWILHVYPSISGATFFAAWGFDNTTPFVVPLVESPPGVWTANTVLPVGVTIYYKFYGKINGSIFWQSSVFGPETLTENKTNEFWYSMPRTIGYWKNWGNHFPASTMAIIVGEVNSDANGFSIVFRGNGDVGCYQLTVGTSGPKGAIPGVAGYLQDKAAVLMYQMLRAQLLGLDLNVAVYQVGGSIPPATNEGMVVGVSPDATVYLYKASGFSGYSDPAVNPWFGETTRTVLQIIQTVESAASGGTWSAWTRAKQEFAKNIVEAINQAGEGGGIGILEP
jgi:hypothetical protein